MVTEPWSKDVPYSDNLRMEPLKSLQYDRDCCWASVMDVVMPIRHSIASIWAFVEAGVDIVKSDG